MPDDTPATFGNDDLYDLLWQTAAYTHLLADEVFSGTPLTISSSSMLIGIAAEPGMTVAEISRRIPKTQQTISQVIARLEKLGLIERRVGSGRGVGLHVTAAGEEMVRVAREREQEINRRLRERLGGTDSDALAEALRSARADLRGPR